MNSTLPPRKRTGRASPNNNDSEMDHSDKDDTNLPVRVEVIEDEQPQKRAKTAAKK